MRPNLVRPLVGISDLGMAVQERELEKGRGHLEGQRMDPMTWTQPEGIDPECIGLCQAMNAMPGITTVESCCGHGETPFQIWFKVARLRDLPRFLYWVDG